MSVIRVRITVLVNANVNVYNLLATICIVSSECMGKECLLMRGVSDGSTTGFGVVRRLFGIGIS